MMVIIVNEKQLIFDFCNWLTEQGCLYEVISYGTDDEIEKMIDNYLMNKKVL